MLKHTRLYCNLSGQRTADIAPSWHITCSKEYCNLCKLLLNHFLPWCLSDLFIYFSFLLLVSFLASDRCFFFFMSSADDYVEAWGLTGICNVGEPWGSEV